MLQVPLGVPIDQLGGQVYGEQAVGPGGAWTSIIPQLRLICFLRVVLPEADPGVDSGDVDQEVDNLLPLELGFPGTGVICPELVVPVNASHVLNIVDDLRWGRDGH